MNAKDQMNTHTRSQPQNWSQLNIKTYIRRQLKNFSSQLKDPKHVKLTHGAHKHPPVTFALNGPRCSLAQLVKLPFKTEQEPQLSAQRRLMKCWLWEQNSVQKHNEVINANLYKV